MLLVKNSTIVSTNNELVSINQFNQETGFKPYILVSSVLRGSKNKSRATFSILLGVVYFS